MSHYTVLYSIQFKQLISRGSQFLFVFTQCHMVLKGMEMYYTLGVSVNSSTGQ